MDERVRVRGPGEGVERHQREGREGCVCGPTKTTEANQEVRAVWSFMSWGRKNEVGV